MRQAADRTGQEFEPLITATAIGTAEKYKDAGFFTEGDNKTGRWKKQDGYLLDRKFLDRRAVAVGRPDQRREYKRWAELWNSRLLGKEGEQNHDTGFLNFYGSAFGWRQTKDQKYRESTLRAAARLKPLYNPNSELVASWELNGDDTIVDTMLNLQIWWFVSKEAGDPQWRELGLKHARRSAAWLVRPDGGVIQSVHYNTGDNRQEFSSHGVKVRQPQYGEAGRGSCSRNTHQGFAADTAWGRGTAWALYGFAESAKSTKDAGCSRRRKRWRRSCSIVCPRTA